MSVADFMRNSSQNAGCIFRSPASHCCHVRHFVCTRSAASVCESFADLRAARISWGDGLLAISVNSLNRCCVVEQKGKPLNFPATLALSNHSGSKERRSKPPEFTVFNPNYFYFGRSFKFTGGAQKPMAFLDALFDNGLEVARYGYHGDLSSDEHKPQYTRNARICQAVSQPRITDTQIFKILKIKYVLNQYVIFLNNFVLFLM